MKAWKKLSAAAALAVACGSAGAAVTEQEAARLGKAQKVLAREKLNDAETLGRADPAKNYPDLLAAL